MGLTLNLGFDRGNARTNVATIPDGTNAFLEIDVSSMIAEGNMKRYQMIQSGSGGTDHLGTNELTVEHEGNVYFLADFADQGRNPTTGFGDKNRYHGKHTKIALMGYAAMIATRIAPNVHESAANIVMGVPFRAYQEQQEKIVDELIGRYDYSFRGRSFTLHIDSVRVFMEGAGAAIYQGFEKDATIGVVDSGSLTTNILRFDGARAHTEECTSFEIGIGTALERLNTRFEEKYGRELFANEKQQILYASLGQSPYPELHADGNLVEINDLRLWISSAIAETGRDKNTQIAKIWSSQSGKTASSFKRVLHVGGGSYYFHKSLQQIIKFAECPVEPERANSRGFAVLANQIAQRKGLKRA